MVLQGVANRDVKLENTLLVSSARPLIKLCDFGYSKVRNDPRKLCGVTQAAGRKDVAVFSMGLQDVTVVSHKMLFYLPVG